MTLHILTLTWQGKDKLIKLKNSLLPALQDIPYEWHIKENGSTDGSVEEIETWKDMNINLIKYAHNRDNYAQGMNILFEGTSAKSDDIILTLNNDVVFYDPQSLHKMIAILKNDKNIGVVGAKLNYTDTKLIQHCGVLFHKKHGLPFHVRAGVKEEKRDCVNRYYPAVTGAVTMLKADTFANCYKNSTSGRVGFKEDFFFAFEDVDMCMRIINHLKQGVVYCGETGIFHDESATLKKNPIHKMFLSKNCNIFLGEWNKHINISLLEKYDDPAFNVYKGKKS